ncbi:alpha/beta hydrolase [Pseudoteredinibacter isoporae]|uniref:Acetyl esterase/lipase n=1 Tax=Pseudoteredinibacter isoporae TaxID=570281 RepID=A0A7X0JS30_9GAMM|nr:alpha/beta hydrolase [Pseudoteredinibacter isoporae]MBB6520356.1 acetyl esterase/lipase [Pseudoteredinibacter isoporae]NHO85926.1 alpha/beta hydrolase [Pseudoteredinibacter isoporae]NIB25622.1 alpha/beta hydrolase [Pseudoteredinibacter isoporae]
MPIDDQKYQQVIEHMEAVSAATRQSGGETVAKRALLDMYCAADPSISAIKSRIYPVIASDGDLNVTSEWVIAPNSQAGKRLLYIHGGSWMAGSPATHRSITSRLAELTGCEVLAIAYRLAPEFPFPNGLNDCIASYKWLLENERTDQKKAEKIYVSGDSAGGNLSLSLVLALQKEGIQLPNAVAAISPATSLDFASPTVHTNKAIDPIINADLLPLVVENYTQGADVSDPLVSPSKGDLSQLPPTLLQTGEREVLLGDSIIFADAAKEQGSEVEVDLWPDMPHVFQGFAPFLPEADLALEKISEFLLAH